MDTKKVIMDERDKEGTAMQQRRFPEESDGSEILDQLTKNWERWQQQFPKSPILVVGGIFLLGVLLWLATGFYVVGPGEQGVVRRFGKKVALTGPGLRHHWPYPIERVDVVNMEVVRRVEVGFRSTPRYRLVPEESLMLTGDENIVDAQAIVQYQVKDPGDYLFRVLDPDQALRDATEVGLRSVIGRTTIEDVLTVGRVRIQESTRDFLQHLLDTYQAGLLVTEVKLQVVDPPEQVKDSFHEVVRAREDRERLINEARGYMEDVMPKARGQAEQIIRAAEAYKAQREIRATGDAAKFLSILAEYQKAQDITEQRLYIETLQRVLPKAQKIVISPRIEGGILPFLPLREAGPRMLTTPSPEAQRGQGDTMPMHQQSIQTGRVRP
jgi:membrane protease subunit HflK